MSFNDMLFALISLVQCVISMFPRLRVKLCIVFFDYFIFNTSAHNCLSNFYTINLLKNNYIPTILCTISNACYVFPIK